MKKKLLAAVLALCMLLSLAACGESSASSAASASEAASSAETSTVSEAPASESAEASEPAAASEASGASAASEASEEPETPAYDSYELSAEDEVTYTGSLIPSWESKGVSSTFILGALAKGSTVEGNLTDLAETGEDGITISNVEVRSELGDALNDKSATNTGFLAVEGAEEDTSVSLSNAALCFSDESDGKNANDFTALGTVVTATGGETTDTRLMMDNVQIETDGFGRDGVVVDAYANAVMTKSSILAKGNNPLTEAYEGYASTAAQAYMISPPWVLGIYGGVRAANVLGTNSSFTVVDSTVEAGSWAVISTDDCTTPTVNVVDSTLKITEYNGTDETGNDSSDSMNGGAALFGYAKNYGSGYGTYNIGSSYENFYGATIDGTTYATILTGAGPTYYGASYEGLELKNEATGEVVYTYEGEGTDTVVQSVFGVMDHQGASDVVLDAGSVWNTEEAVILVRGAQNSTYTVSGAELNPASGIIFQQMDDDDGYGTSGAGGDTTGDQGFLKWTGEAWGMPTFSSGFKDGNAAGFAVPTAGGSYNTTLNLTTAEGEDAVSYTGNIYNGSGTGSGTTPGGLLVNIGEGVTLEGAVSATSAVHGLPYSEDAVAYLDKLVERYGEGVAPNGGESCTVAYALLDKDGNVTTDASSAAWIQVTEFTMNEYYLLSHVINKSMAGANILVSVAEGAVWKVTEDCYITGLMNEGTIEIADGATLYVGGEPYDGKSTEAGDLSAGGSGGSVDTSDWVLGENYRAQCTGKYAEITIADSLYYYVGASSVVSGVAIVDVAFNMKGWLIVGEDGSYTISDEYVEMEQTAMGGPGGPGGPGGMPPDGMGGEPPAMP